MKDITANQHYVPRCYLKHFANDSVKTKKSKIITNFFKFNDSLLKENIPIKSICSKNYFYGKDNSTEKFFSSLENDWSFTLNKIVDSNNFTLTPNEILQIKNFIIWQFSRTLGSLNHHQASFLEIIKYFPEHIKSTLDISIDFVLEITTMIQNILNDLSILIIKFNTTHSLITSDNPVININPLTPNSCGFGNIGCSILLPISPNTLIVLYDSKLYNINNNFMISTNEDDVVKLNKYQTLNSEELIISNNLDMLQLQATDTELLQRRSEILKEDKVEKFQPNPSMNPILFGLANKSVFYYYDLSFLKLPKNLTKINTIFRHPLPRIFTKEAYDSLKFFTYLPAKINRHLPDCYNTKEAKKQKSKYLSFIEDYWNIPLNDRTILPKNFTSLGFKKY